MDQCRPEGLPDLLDLQSTLPNDIDVDQRCRFTSLSPHVSSRADASLALAGAMDVVPGLTPSSPPCNPFFPTVPEVLPEPGPVPDLGPGTPTPLHERPRPDLNLGLSAIVDNALPSTNVSLPTPQILKAGQNLRLPSFDLLGIAAPHPDRFHADSAERIFSPVGAGPLSKPEDPLHAQSPLLGRAQPRSGSEAVDVFPAPHPEATRREQKSYEQSIELLTPPPDATTNYWGTFAHVRTTAMDSPDQSDKDKASPGLTPPSGAAEPSSGELAIRPGPPGAEDDAFSWLDESLQAIVSNLESVGGSSNSVKILSHALPCPSPTGQAFPHIIHAIHEAIPPRSTVWINVFHAVPGRFNMADLPTSPPSTPGPVIGGEDYFTTKVFDSAVPVTDYEGDAKVERSPRPVVAPGSVDVSIVERYIPPTSPSEFAGLFSTNGSRSLLLDRLVELSPENGTLLFIYPTKAGAKTFMSEYLGPILDPLLRSMHVVHNLSSDLGASLGHMQAVEHLYEFDEMADRLHAFCHRLNNESTSLDRFNRARATFSVIQADKKRVRPNRKVWAADWWIKQEKPRVRAAVSKYFRLAQRLPVDAEIMPTNLIQEILDGVHHKQYENGEPAQGIEVGVFVIRRSS